ncbi:MAG: polysulfide reductase NrfD [Gammaproteobacteria bacterium]|nr:polysulfide reductase NrfD [Gammaproteobacteria bacterium]
MFPNESITNFVFPNNVHIEWSLMIVVYPYITGLVAGAFVVSALYHVFKVKEFECISRFGLVASFCFGLFAATPLLIHLGQPQRAFNIFFTPHTTSAMSIFGYVYSSYMILLIVELWFVYREYFIQQATTTSGWQQKVWKILTLGVLEYTPAAGRLDHKIVTFLAAIGIPWAFALHGYVGFIFGSVKAIAWWATPLQPIIFLISAIVSGIAVLTLMCNFVRWRAGHPYDYVMLRKLMIYLWGIFILDVVIEVLEVVFVLYEKGHHWSVVGPLLFGPLFLTYTIGQLLVCSGVPLLVLGYAVLSNVSGKQLLYLANIASLLIALQVLLMRFNVVIGGQLISKSGRGFSEFHFEWFAREGVLMAAVILVAPFVAYWFIQRLLPIFDNQPVAGGGAATR